MLHSQIIAAIQFAMVLYDPDGSGSGNKIPRATPALMKLSLPSSPSHGGSTSDCLMRIFKVFH
jgi:hypothetical protein